MSFLYNFEQKRKIPPNIPKIGNEFDLYGLISVDSAAIRSKAVILVLLIHYLLLLPWFIGVGGGVLGLFLISGPPRVGITILPIPYLDDLVT